jgi:hypothetical protein
MRNEKREMSCRQNGGSEKMKNERSDQNGRSAFILHKKMPNYLAE